MNVNLEYYKVFYYVCRCGSLTGAAQELCISQPAVSQAVRQLEKEAGVRLFVRTSKGVQLTREGELLYRYVKNGVEQLLEGGRMLKRMLDMEMGEVRIGASDMTLQFFLLPYLEQFHRRYPRIKVNVTNAPTPETIRSLEEGKIDFGVVTTPFSCRSAMKQTSVKQIRSVFIAGSSFSYLKGQVLEYRELLHLPCIFLEKNTSSRSFMDEFLLKQGIELKAEFELAISDMIVQFVKRNMGIGCVMEGFAREAIDRGEVFELTFCQEMPLRDICVVTGESSLISMAGRSLLDMITGDKPDL
ncbi:MAG: LysR family transcriptional regulator [Enterocloster sp.]